MGHPVTCIYHHHHHHHHHHHYHHHHHHHYHHHHCLWPLVGHRPPTRALQASQSRASLLSYPQVYPFLFVSAYRSRLRVFLRRPRFLFPCGFQVRAWRVMQVIGFWRVRSIHLQRLWRISSSAGCCLVRFQSSLLLMIALR